MADEHEHLESLILEAARLTREIEEYVAPRNKRKEEIKAEIRIVRENAPGLFEDKTGQSVTRGVAGFSVTITQPKTPVHVDFPALIGLMGLELFTEIFTVTDADMDKRKWDHALYEEKVKESWLEDCIIEGKKPTAQVRFA